LGLAFRHLFRAPTRDVAAVAGLSLRVARGERVALVGENGAGKSTTIKLLTGILHPTSGDATVLSLTPWKERTRLAFRIGTVFGQRSQLWQHLPAGDTFDLLARVYEQDRDLHRRRRAELVEGFAVGALLHRPVRTLSLGERMRLELVASLLHAPEVLFLDEPTIGLDVSAKAAMRDLVRERSERDGLTLLLTSHDTGDMERVCERAVVLHRGTVLLDRPVRDLRRGYIRRKVVTLLTEEPSVAVDLPGVETVSREPHRTTLEVDVSKTPVEAVVQAALRGARVQDLTVEDPPMDEIVRAIYAAANAAAPS
jgi:ABC-2 type transport system ATP-binding protein